MMSKLDNLFDNIGKIYDDFFDDKNFSEINLPVAGQYKKTKFLNNIDERKHLNYNKYYMNKFFERAARTIFIKKKAHKINKNLDAIINNINKLVTDRGNHIACRR